jgi:hypothetical protein
MPKAAMPADVLLDELIGDTSSDYADGDNPGYFRYSFDPASGELTVRYEPDGEAGTEYAETITVFRFAGTYLASLYPDDGLTGGQD